MGAINDAFNKAGWSVLSLASATAKYRSKRNEEGKNRAKLNYSTAATIKKQNNVLTKKQSEPPKSYFDINSPLPPEKDEQKISEQKVLEQMAQERAKATSFGELAGAEKTFKQADTPTKKEVVEAKKPVQRFGELAGVEEAPTPQPIKAENTEPELPTVSAEHSETNISAKDPEVQGLIQAKQKNMNRSISASRAQKEYQASKGYENDFPIRDYMPTVSDAELRKAGITKTELNKLSSILAGNGTDEDVRNWFDRHGGVDGAYTINLDDLRVTEQAADAIKNYILNKDEPNDIDSSVEAKDLKQPSVDDWYLNFDRNNNTMSNSDNYKVWQDDSTEEEKEKEKDEVKTDRNFSGIKF